MKSEVVYNRDIREIRESEVCDTILNHIPIVSRLTSVGYTCNTYVYDTHTHRNCLRQWYAVLQISFYDMLTARAITMVFYVFMSDSS